MIRAVLFDLDDTLLGNETDPFVQRYFTLLSEYAQEKLPPDQFLAALLRASREMVYNTDPTMTNYAIFWRSFAELSGLDAREMEQFFNGFYADVFPQMRPLTMQRAVARPLIEYCLAQGWQVVVATNPMFPRVAIEQRLLWAGVPVCEQQYALVTTLENMHSTKPNVTYYEEILDVLGVAADTAVMVGDDWINDIQPAAQLGIRTFWITQNVTEPPDASLIEGFGTLDDFYAWIQGASV